MVEFDLLSALGNTEGMRMKDLADVMITTAPNLTRVCDAMEAKGLVERRRSPQSDREVVARLTPEGQKLFEELFPLTVNESARILDEALSKDELVTLSGLLDKLIAGLAKQQP